eukprot:4983723-Alexandrium_andersonii.AAC.1
MRRRPSRTRSYASDGRHAECGPSPHQWPLRSSRRARARDHCLSARPRQAPARRHPGAPGRRAP